MTSHFGFLHLVPQSVMGRVCVTAFVPSHTSQKDLDDNLVDAPHVHSGRKPYTEGAVPQAESSQLAVLAFALILSLPAVSLLAQLPDGRYILEPAQHIVDSQFCRIYCNESYCGHVPINFQLPEFPLTRAHGLWVPSTASWDWSGYCDSGHVESFLTSDGVFSYSYSRDRCQDPESLNVVLSLPRYSIAGAGSVTVDYQRYSNGFNADPDCTGGIAFYYSSEVVEPTTFGNWGTLTYLGPTIPRTLRTIDPLKIASWPAITGEDAASTLVEASSIAAGSSGEWTSNSRNFLSVSRSMSAATARTGSSERCSMAGWPPSRPEDGPG